ncbi:SMC family ATPase [Thermatribacter velox]|jgi:exonuclease SbcC|uniref:SMC family ATPase n=1 Tax=Thermatribacter velox TaxID=3039681 RepID=A0ABZ2YB70_9BACT
MRPVSIKVKNFLGLENLELDFEHNLFVMVGPNGAGKSSILEAIFFALYGKGVRSERSKQELLHRGHPDDALRVEFEFTVGRESYRIIREFSKKQGGSAALEQRLGGNWQTIHSGEERVNQEIQKLIGFDASTFRASVFLPQGETLSFVEATPAKRFNILSSLFGLDILDAIHQKVKNRLDFLEGNLGPRLDKLRLLKEADLEGQIEILQKERSELEKSIAKLKKEEETIEHRKRLVEKAVDEEKKRRSLSQQIEVLKAEIKEAEARAQLDRDIQKALEVNLNFYQPLIRCQENLTQLEKERTQKASRIQELNSSIANLDQEIKTSAQKLVHLLQEKDHHQLIANILQEKVKPALEETRALKPQIALLQRKYQDLLKRESDLSQAIKNKEKDLFHLREKTQAIQEKLQTEKSWLKVIEHTLESIAALEEERKGLEREKQFLEEEKTKKERENILLKQELDEALNRVKIIEETLSQMKKREIAMEEAHHKILKTYLVNELNEEWKQSGTCPLCGTVKPAPPVSEQPTADILEEEKRYRAFREELTRTSSELEKWKEKRRSIDEKLREKSAQLERDIENLKTLQTKILEIRKNMIGVLKEHQLDKEGIKDFSSLQRFYKHKNEIVEGLFETLHNASKDLQEAATYLASWKKQIGDLQSEIQNITRELLEKETYLRQKRQFIFSILKENKLPFDPNREIEQNAQEIIEATQNKIQELFESSSNLENRKGKLEERKKAQEEKLRELTQELRELEQKIQEVAQQSKSQEKFFLEEIGRLGWSEDYFKSLKDQKPGNWQERKVHLEGKLQHLQKELIDTESKIKAYEAELHTEHARFSELAQNLAVQLVELKEAIRAANEKLGSKRQAIQNLQEKIQEKEQLEAELEKIIQERNLHKTLKEALESKGFKNFLLGLLFEQLEKETSTILADISQGRYTVSMKMEGGKATLAVIDNLFGGQERSPGECSGGEKTLIALALAIALSRVRFGNESGKSGANCIFIDEGFSALDREHLELVADAILNMGKDGKLVGIVTHDPLFATYFPVRLNVSGGKASWITTEEEL